MYKVIIAAFTRGSLFSGFLIVSSPVTTKETKYLLLITNVPFTISRTFLSILHTLSLFLQQNF